MMAATTKPNETTPWYKQGWPWFLLSLPATAVVAGFITLGIAIKTWERDGLVVDDYQKEGRAISRTIGRNRLADSLGLTAVVNINESGLIFRLSAAEVENLPNKIIVTIAHPTRSGEDRVLFLTAKDQGFFESQIAPLNEGQWLFQIEDELRKWRMSGAAHVPTETEINIKPSSSSSGS